MVGQRVGYIRVSSFDQNPERQLDEMMLDGVFTDRCHGYFVHPRKIQPFALAKKAGRGKWPRQETHRDERAHLPSTTLHGRTTFDWLEGGAFLIMHSEIDDRTW